ncbi:hypothetical protein A3K73_04005 [Candidatus Pacearchaeota archaeon RBG_13_36_9]|nr:MAG: hypothetical protein A3K73_04005 [Candidatus Pacearchaeota archaeon RBG_13_36_9]
MPNTVSGVIEQLRKIDKANYTYFVRQKEIRRRKNENYQIPFFREIITIYLRSQQIADSMINAYSNSADRALAYATVTAIN